MPSGSTHSGDLRYRIIIQRDDTVRAASGAKKPFETVFDFASVWGDMQFPSTGREFPGQKFPISYQPTEWIIRRLGGVTSDMRVKFIDGGVERYFPIRSIKRYGPDSEFMTLSCEEIH